MPGGLISLIAVGVQDAYITGNPTITFFKALYRRHTNFALEAIEQTFSGVVDFGRTGVSATIARNGDLISRMYIKAKVQITQEEPGRCAFVRNIGHSMLTEYSCLIGGAQIDKQCGEWMTIKNSLTMEPGQVAGYNQMVGNTKEMTELKDRSSKTEEYTIYVPLNFWFCNSYSQALPIIALQYHDVRVNVNFRDASKLVVTEGCRATVKMTDATLLIDYILLDTQERKLFATQPHEMLIEQLQYPTPEPFAEGSKKFRLTLNHPCKHVTWAAKLDKWSSNKQFLAYHPTDVRQMKLRAAELVYLLSMGYGQTGDDKTFRIDTKGSIDATYGSTALQTDSTFQINEWKSSPVLANVISKIKGKMILVGGQDDNGSPSTLAGFLKDPFAHIELIDKSFLDDVIFDELISTPVDVLGLTSVVSTDVGGGFTNLQDRFKRFFVNVNMYDNFGTTIDGRLNPIKQGVIQINGQDRFSARDGAYFNYVQPFQHWPNTPADGINTYSFALKPAEYQPSGTLNFSRVDYATLNLDSDAMKTSGPGASGGGSLSYYTMNYNILRVLGGMGGCAYSN